MHLLRGLLLLLSLAGGRCQYASFIQSPAEVTVSRGQAVALECAVANVGTNQVNMNWIWQSPGQKPEGVLFFKTDLSIYQAPGIPDRFVPSRDASNKKLLLTIRDVQEGDDFVYFCFAFYDSAGVQTWGEGTRVRVRRTNLPQPRMQLFPPAREELATGSTTLTCLVSGFFPSYVEVQWKKDGQSTEQGMHTGQAALAEDQTYVISSYLTVPASKWCSGARYSCVAQHESLPGLLEKDVSAKDCKAEKPSLCSPAVLA